MTTQCLFTIPGIATPTQWETGILAVKGGIEGNKPLLTGMQTWLKYIFIFLHCSNPTKPNPTKSLCSIWEELIT